MSLSDQLHDQRVAHWANQMLPALEQDEALFAPLYHQAVASDGETIAGEAAMDCLTALRKKDDIDLAMAIHRVVPAWPKPLLHLACALGRMDYMDELVELINELLKSSPNYTDSQWKDAAIVSVQHNQQEVVDYFWPRLSPHSQSFVLCEAIVSNQPLMVKHLQDKGVDLYVDPEHQQAIMTVLLASKPRPHVIPLLMPFMTTDICSHIGSQLDQWTAKLPPPVLAHVQDNWSALTKAVMEQELSVHGVERHLVLSSSKPSKL